MVFSIRLIFLQKGLLLCSYKLFNELILPHYRTFLDAGALCCSCLLRFKPPKTLQRTNQFGDATELFNCRQGKWLKNHDQMSYPHVSKIVKLASDLFRRSSDGSL